jgi:hypothetical protein
MKEGQSVDERLERSPAGGDAAKSGRQYVMSHDEITRAAPLSATEPARAFEVDPEPALNIESADEPEIQVRCKRLSDGEQWHVPLESQSGLVLPGLIGKTHDLLELEELQATAAGMAVRPVPAAVARQ